MATIAIAGYYGFGNAGDELVLHAIIQQLRSEGSSARIIVFSNSPSATEKYHRVKAVQRWSFIEMSKTLYTTDRFVLGGGGLLQESTSYFNHPYYLALLFLAKSFRCSTELASVGVDPIRHPLNRWLTRVVLNICSDMITVRDEASRQALLDVGVTIPISVTADPVASLRVAHSTEQRNGIAFALHGKSSSVDEWLRLLNELTRQWSTPIDLLVFFPQQDELLAEALGSTCKGVRHVRVVRDPLALLDWISEYELVVASRFHALVLAASANIPFIGCGDQKKIEQFCAFHHMPYIPTGFSTTPDTLLSRILAQRTKVVR